MTTQVLSYNSNCQATHQSCILPYSLYTCAVKLLAGEIGILSTAIQSISIDSPSLYYSSHLSQGIKHSPDEILLIIEIHVIVCGLQG